MSLVPKHIKELKPYVAGKSKKEFKRKFGDRDSIKLASNENPLGCSPKSIQRAQIHINNCNRYPDSSGFELREKLANKYGERKTMITDAILRRHVHVIDWFGFIYFNIRFVQIDK